MVHKEKGINVTVSKAAHKKMKSKIDKSKYKTSFRAIINEFNQLPKEA